MREKQNALTINEVSLVKSVLQEWKLHQMYTALYILHENEEQPYVLSGIVFWRNIFLQFTAKHEFNTSINMKIMLSPNHRKL